jgi:histidine triad (HIT) family protein
MERDCIFCEIIRGEKPAEIVYENDSLMMFKDIRPHAPVHLLVVPKRHIRSVNDLSEADEGLISEMILGAKEMAGQLSIARSGYKLVFNVERGGGQYVFHLHMHLLGGR